jgi:hypothetical protein
MERSTAVLLTAHLTATAAMAGLIWFVQIVHYPLFHRVGRERFAAYEGDHQRRTSWVVGPPMAVEGATAIILVFAAVPGVGRWFRVASLGMLGVVQASTLLLQVPRHGQLGEGYEEETVRRLVSSNWIRTVGWTARAVAAATMVVLAAS